MTSTKPLDVIGAEARAREVLASLGQTQRQAIIEAKKYVSGGWRLHYKHAGPTMRILTELGILNKDSSYLNEFGLEVRKLLLAFAEQSQAEARKVAIALLTGEPVGGGDGGTFVVRTPTVEAITDALLAFAARPDDNAVGERLRNPVRDYAPIVERTLVAAARPAVSREGVIRECAEIANEAFRSYAEPTERDYGAQDACTKIERAILQLLQEQGES